jgi:hypothetical protein
MGVPRFTPGTHRTGSWVGPRAGLDTEARGKILLLLSEIDCLVVQSVARHYTDWTTRLLARHYTDWTTRLLTFPVVHWNTVTILCRRAAVCDGYDTKKSGHRDSILHLRDYGTDFHKIWHCASTLSCQANSVLVRTGLLLNLTFKSNFTPTDFLYKKLIIVYKKLCISYHTQISSGTSIWTVIIYNNKKVGMWDFRFSRRPVGRRLSSYG